MLCVVLECLSVTSSCNACVSVIYVTIIVVGLTKVMVHGRYEPLPSSMGTTLDYHILTKIIDTYYQIL